MNKLNFFEKDDTYYLEITEDDLCLTSIDEVYDHPRWYKGTFLINENNSIISKDESSVYVKVAYINDGFYRLNNDTFGISHYIYFEKEITFKAKYFVLPNRISIIRKIDEVINDDLYVLNNDNREKENAITINELIALIKNFPNRKEKELYAELRVSELLSNYLSVDNAIEEKFFRIVNRKNKILIEKPSNLSIISDELRIEELNEAKISLENLIKNEARYKINEKAYQKAVFDVFKILFPKYLYSAREVLIPGIDNHDKQPDFVACDYSGFLDIVEIKKPETQLLANGLYRNNYVPSNDLKGVIQQVEKYTYCLNKCNDKEIAKISNDKFKSEIPTDFVIKSMNPQGIIIVGNRNQLINDQMLEDFELIKREFKNIIDIYTYDQLLEMLNNSIKAISNNIHNRKIK